MKRPIDHARRGANAVEFALVLPLLLMFLGGIFDYSIFFMTRSATYRAALEGIRVGAMGTQLSAATDAETAFRAAYTAAGYDEAKATVTSSLVTINAERNVNMDVNVPFNPPFGFGKQVLPDAVHFNLSMRMEDQE